MITFDMIQDLRTVKSLHNAIDILILSSDFQPSAILRTAMKSYA
jgi:hypothetical protein